MPNTLDYLRWRGDIPIKKVDFSDIDLLILSQLSYIRFDSIIPTDFSSQITLRDAAKAVLSCDNAQTQNRIPHPNEDPILLNLLINSVRFSELNLTGFVNTFNKADEEQFSAFTALLPDGSSATAFRGTDSTLVGWKEDFNMAISESVPAQRDAVSYIEHLSQNLNGYIRLGGHSKGGNLAVYGAAFCPENIQSKIIQVRNFDGPGFSKKIVESREYKRIINRVHTFLPSSSIIGMLLEHDEDYTIIESSKSGIFQHNAYSWQIIGNNFNTIEALTNSSRFIDATMKEWIANMSPSIREKFINGLYMILTSGDSMTLRELLNGRNIISIIKAADALDKETRELMKEALHVFRLAAKSSMTQFSDGTAFLRRDMEKHSEISK